MRTLDVGFAAHIASGATTLATCWRIARRDGVVLGFTDHDVALSFGGTDYLPAHGLDGGEAAQKLGPQVDTGEVRRRAALRRRSARTIFCSGATTARRSRPGG